MQDIPIFSTDNGVATLVLKELPYCGDAYIRIHDASNLDAFLLECYDFCVMAGAKSVYASGMTLPEKYLLYTDVWKMECSRSSLPQTDAALVPLQKEALEQWRELYNDRMEHVPTASYMSYTKANEILEKGNGYFVCREDSLIGLGVVTGNVLDCIISLAPGAGQDVLCALCGVFAEDTVLLEVASKNERAITLYRKLGFVVTETVNTWYAISP